MNTKKINEQAIESLKTYFNEGKILLKKMLHHLLKIKLKLSLMKKLLIMKLNYMN